MQRLDSLRGHARGFTLLEVALIVAIIGMMMMMIIGYLMAPNRTGPLPPIEPPKLIRTPEPKATPAATATPARTTELNPGVAPAFR